MSKVLPILFNTDMVRAILDGRKTVTRRCVKYKYSNTEMKMRTDKYGTRLIEIQKDVEGETFGRNPDGTTWHKLLGCIEPKSPYQPGDILYVRETWAFLPCVECTREGTDCGRICVTYEDRDGISDGCFVYRADHPHPEHVSWSPSIHMPKAAARIWLKVKDVRVERLQEIKPEDMRKEGMRLFITPDECKSQFDKIGAIYFYQEEKKEFLKLWDSTIKKSDRACFGWDANPWVWVIEFERCKLQS